MANSVDYSQAPEDHQSLLVLVRHIGTQLPTQNFNRVFEKISRVDRLYVQGQKRNISIRYRKMYPLDFNSWGDFQGHRKVLGLISVGKGLDHEEFGAIFTSYKTIKEEYSSTIINSRLIVFGMNTDGSPLESQKIETDSNDSGISSKSSEEAEKVHDCDENKSSCPDGMDDSSTPTSDPCESTPKILEPVSEQSEEENKQDSVPSESNTSNGTVNSQSLNVPKSDEKRTHSNSLTKESSGSEIVFYPDTDNCKDLEERIKEFVTSLYYVLEGKRLDRSFERSDKLILLCAPFEKKDYVGVDTDTKSFRKKCMGRLRKHLGDLCLQAAMPGEAVLHYNTALDLLRAVNDFLWMGGCLEGLCCAAVILAYPKSSPLGLKRNLSFQTKRGSPLAEPKARSGSSYANGLDTLTEGIGTTQPGLNIDDVVEKYTEAIINYSKFKNAAVIEMEACLKACRFLISQHKYLQASNFLQNVVYINLPTPEDDRIQRYNTLSALYSQIGFKRKAAFFKRVSGMHCVAPDSSPSWNQCYELLLQSLEGYSLSVNPREMERDHSVGWPVLQFRVLHELVYAARRMSNAQIAVRHMTLLIDTMLPNLNVNDQREAIQGLSTLTLKCPGTPQPIALDSGLILPPVPLLSLPTVRSFRLLPPSPHLQASKLESSDTGNSSGVFIYTPILSSNKRTNESKPDFKWVCGDVCEASLQLMNPLADELKIFYMGLLTSDLETEIFPANPVIPPDSGLMNVKLMVKPKATGILKVLGYTTVVFGVKSNCRLRDLVNLRPSPMTEIVIEVVPPLPQVALSCSLPKSTVFTSGSGSADVIATGSAVLFAGQSTECIVTLQNTSEYSVELLSVKLNSKNDAQGVLSRVLSWSEENIQSQLPLQPTNQLCFSLCVNGDSDFLLPQDPPVRSPSQANLSRAENADSREKSLEAVLSLQYSGAEGLKAGYCRQCSLALNVDILPSVYITSWDVQHTDSLDECRLCLDLVNVSSHQIEVQYGHEKQMILEPQQTRRISFNVPRLDPAQVDTTQVPQNRIPLHYRTKIIPDPYSQVLASYVDIWWTMPVAKASGKVGIDYIKWTSEQLLVLLMPDVRWEVCLNQQPFLPSSRFRFAVGDIVEVAVTVENTTGEERLNSDLCIEPSQHHMEGDLGLEDTSLAVIGSSVLHLTQIPSGSETKHSCSFTFFSPGWYTMAISCKQAVSVISNLAAVRRCEDGSGDGGGGGGGGGSGRSSSRNSSAGKPSMSLESDDNSKAALTQMNKDWVCTIPVRFEVL